MPESPAVKSPSAPVTALATGTPLTGHEGRHHCRWSDFLSL